MNKKRTIVLASLLKPVDDPRMFEKFALSMSQTNKYAINIIGFSSKNIPTHPDITFYPAFNFKRLSLQRLLAPLKYWQILLKVKPEIIIANTPDLLLVSCAHQILFGSKVVYDIRENYLQNIIWSSGLPAFIKYPLAWLTRGNEMLAKRMIIHFFMAEVCYLSECSFIREPFTILENKARFPLADQLSSISRKSYPLWVEGSFQELRLIYSGTIAESYGIFDSLELVEKWISKGIKVHLTIIGYCPRKDTLQELLLKVKDKPYIRLIGGDGLVPHPEILQELKRAHFSLISYRLNPSNRGCFPTRVWECLAHQLPMIMKKDHPWIPLLEEFGAGFAVDYSNPPSEIPIPPNGFYKQKPIPPSFYWENEEKKLLKALESLF